MRRRYNYQRRETTPVGVGGIEIGGQSEVRVQSMASRRTMDTEGSVEQACRMAEAGAELIRFTAQGVREAENLGVIREALRSRGVDVPLVADIHFNPRAAFAAAAVVEKVRINPGNFVDPGRTFQKLEFTEEEYAGELEKVDAALTPFLAECKRNGTAIRIGVNHGSLSDRIMSRYGDTPAGMVESAMEFLRVCRKREFGDVVISIKASNVKVMVETVRRLVDAMEAEGMAFPIHLGVTEAGDGDDGRVKSAVGIGTLLAEGIGDTIRVSLSEEPEMEMPVARELCRYVTSRRDAEPLEIEEPVELPLMAERKSSRAIGKIGGGNEPVVAGRGGSVDVEIEEIKCAELDAEEVIAHGAAVDEDATIVLRSRHANVSGALLGALDRLRREGVDNPAIIAVSYNGLTAEQTMIRASADLGRVVLEGYADGVMIESDSMGDKELSRLGYGILQATRYRFTRTEYIACPGCGRTLFDLQQTLRRVKEATEQLRGLKIGVMGCVVNGPGEMADADYGYVGAGVGKVSLYRGKECVEKNIATEEAVERLVALIKEDGRWK